MAFYCGFKPISQNVENRHMTAPILTPFVKMKKNGVVTRSQNSGKNHFSDNSFQNSENLTINCVITRNKKNEYFLTKIHFS